MDVGEPRLSSDLSDSFIDLSHMGHMCPKLNLICTKESLRGIDSYSPVRALRLLEYITNIGARGALATGMLQRS